MGFSPILSIKDLSYGLYYDKAILEHLLHEKRKIPLFNLISQETLVAHHQSHSHFLLLLKFQAC